jgi:UDP-N-acetylmuramyl pentapeptide phosphotransferase/UDP-N-acetylglucosamine-1-phosphate transferase
MNVASLTYATMAALVVGAGLQPLVVRLMTSASVLDIPSERSSHTTPTPRGGGVAVQARPLAVPVLLCAVIGLVEDVRGVPILPRFASQLVVGAGTGLVLMPPGARTEFQVGIVAATAVWMTAFVNAFNFMDGINGISVAQALVAGTAYVIIGSTLQLPVLTVGGAIIVAVALAFAPFNFPTAVCFLGDVGSYFLGAWLAVLVVIGLRAGVTPEAMLAPTGVYLLDTASTLIRRVRMGESWWQPHRSHVYQRLTRLGWSHTTTTAFVGSTMLVCSMLGTLSLLGSTTTRIVGDAGIAVALAIYVTTPRHVTLRRESRVEAERPVRSAAAS